MSNCQPWLPGLFIPFFPRYLMNIEMTRRPRHISLLKLSWSMALHMLQFMVIKGGITNNNGWIVGNSYRIMDTVHDKWRFAIQLFKTFMEHNYGPFVDDLPTSSTAQGGGGSFKNRKPIGELGCCESGMAERSHWWTERSLRSPLFLSFSDYLPTYLPIYLSIDRSIDLSIYLSLI